jgi:hypothetical protein
MSKRTLKKIIFCCILKATDEKSRIPIGSRIRKSAVLIRKSLVTYGSVDPDPDPFKKVPDPQHLTGWQGTVVFFSGEKKSLNV